MFIDDIALRLASVHSEEEQRVGYFGSELSYAPPEIHYNLYYNNLYYNQICQVQVTQLLEEKLQQDIMIVSPTHTADQLVPLLLLMDIGRKNAAIVMFDLLSAKLSSDIIYPLDLYLVIQKHPNDFNNVEIDESIKEDGDLSLMVYRSVEGPKGVKEILSWDSSRQDQFTKDEAFHDIFKILKMQLPGGKHDLTVQDPIAELRYYAARENYSLQWLYNSKSSSKKHEVILSESITGSGESSTKACYQARGKLQHKVNKTFKFYRERYLEEIQAQNPKMSEGESFDIWVTNLEILQKKGTE
ncbi:uncharacterized protein FOMMEDRAFT_30425 [Fomitiporia mediterranea MF3/22]|uniref:uncharacterized protein n=1 Tax=Fomitiporia mediterranea (strain MF3/22) TaxID=694068 RepID=UPI0004408583|nr:uncharacterized protein FOMMEDRAFT_30425 [Fomitiporia mediterranea MF3/22]EJD00353.1 hypothetical protein FOMMEDRAFT_30425 [Fomitiporia mediterranea MF3/22]